MLTGRKARRALWALWGLGVAAIAATVVLILGIEHRTIALHEAMERATIIELAKQRCEDLKGVLLSHITPLLDRRGAEVASLLELATEVRAELASFATLKEAGQGVHMLVVDEKLQPIWPIPREGEHDLRPCARHLLEQRECSFVLPRDAERSGRMPKFLCCTYPIRRHGQPLGGIVIHRELDDPMRDVFASLSRKMTLTVVITQSVLLLVLGAVACFARKAVEAAERHAADGDRLAAVGNLAAGVAHEVRNPLNTIALTTRYLERLIGRSTLDPELRAEANKNFEIVAAELGRLTRTLDNFVLLAKPADLALRDCDLTAVADETLALFARELAEAGVRLLRQEAEPLPVRGDGDRLGQVFSNIIRNAMQAMPDGGTLSVATEAADGFAHVRFADTGQGVSPDHLHRVFEPYFSTKRSGLGLGLALSRRIAEAHGGTLEASNPPGGGALFAVRIPIRPNPGEAGHAR